MTLRPSCRADTSRPHAPSTKTWQSGVGHWVPAGRPNFPIPFDLQPSDRNKGWTLGFDSEREFGDVLGLGTGPRDIVGAIHRIM
jgi:hypothetical protein